MGKKNNYDRYTKKRFTENKERHLVISFEEAEKMGVRLMNEEEYRYLQTLHLAGL